MARKSVAGALAAMAVLAGCLGMAAAAGAATTTQLLLSQSAAFSILGHSCGGIQEQVYATGFALNGYPAGDVYMKTTCGGSGRGGGYTSTTYTAWASATWDWFGDTRSYARLEGAAEGISQSFSAEDAYGDRIYNVGTAAYLETTAPPLQAPAAPTGVSAVSSPIEVGEQLVLRFQVSWTAAGETAGLITSSTVTATPVGSNAPVVTTTVSGSATSAIVGPLAPSTTYRITVTNSDREGTSEASAPIEATSPNEDGGTGGGTEAVEEGPEFGRCLKAPSEKAGTETIYHGRFTTANCEEESTSQSGKYEWHPGVVKGGFTTALKPTTLVSFETVYKTRLTCTGESGSGTVSGAKTVGNVVLHFTGCESGGQRCTTGSLAEGELETANLEGVLGVERVTEKEGKEIRHIALDLYPVGRTGPLLEYTCAGSGPIALSGSVIAPAPAGKMAKSATVKFTASGGRQKPEGFEGGAPDVLTNSLAEQTGLSAALIQSNEEAVEVNPVV